MNIFLYHEQTIQDAARHQSLNKKCVTEKLPTEIGGFSDF